MVLQKLKDKFGEDRPNIVSEHSECPRCGTDGSHHTEYIEQEDGTLKLNEIYCDICD